MYEEACSIKPGDTSSCQRAQAMRDYGIEIRTYRARQLCASGQLGPCIQEFQPLLAVPSDKQHLVQVVVDEAAALATSQCKAADASLGNTLGELSCLQHWQAPLWRGTDFRSHFANRSRGVAGQLTLMADSQAPQNVGARMSLLEAAHCVAPLSAEQNRIWTAAAGEFRSILSTSLHLKYTTNGTTRSAPGTCATITQGLGRSLTCDASAQGSASRIIDAHAEVFGVSARWKKSHRDTQHVAQYKSGTEQVVNPDYDRRRLEYELAETRQADAEREMREEERRCNDSESSVDCDSYDRLRREYDSRRRERDHARNRFNQESPTITRDVYRDHHYVTRHHEWVSPFRASVKLGANEWAPEVTNIIYRDTEQTGFSPAGVQSDPFEPPPEDFFRNQSSQWLTARLQSHVESELTSRAQSLMQRCEGDRMECWARARYWNGDEGFGLPLIEALANREADAQKAAKRELRCTANLLQ
tara:strand:+ start:14540 stop:15958 length:1419 start_codon:yes stop_codon:yes gene_type:complete